MLYLLLVLAAPAPEPDPEPGVYYKSPQAVFDASLKAAEKKDFKAAVECIAPEARREYAASMAASMLMLKNLPIDLPDLADMRKALREVMDKHGLTEKATDGINVGTSPYGDAKTREKLGKLIKKPEAFLLDILSAQDKAQKKLKILADLGKPVMKLTDLKVEGNKAKGVIVATLTGFETKLKVSFVKKANGWRMIPSYEMEPAIVLPAPPPPKDK
jgi:hypothetical protein